MSANRHPRREHHGAQHEGIRIKRKTMRWHVLAAAIACSGVVGAQTTLSPTSPTHALPIGSAAATTATNPGATVTGTITSGSGSMTTPGPGGTTTTSTGGTTATGTGSTTTTGTGSTTPTGTGSATGTANGTGTTTAGTPAPSATPALSGGQMRVAGRVAAPFADIAGSADNALALATALRTGTPANLTFTSTAADGTTVTTTATITPTTKPMGWGNVKHSLALARAALTQANITEPAPADLQAALLGGDVTAADGTKTSLAGVLQQRAAGMGWGSIAKSYGTTMGAVNHTHASPTAAAAPTTTASSGTGSIAVRTPNGTTGSTRGITTAGGTGAPAGSRAPKGLVTASGASPGTIVASSNAGGHASGRGIVTASGASVGSAGPVLHRSAGSGVVTAGGESGTLKTASGGDGHGNSQGHGKHGN